MAVWELPVLCVLSLLWGIKSICTLTLWKGEETSLLQVWTEKRLYVLSGIWLVFYVIIWCCSGRSLTFVRSADLLCTYGVLAVVDGKSKIVPDSVLFYYFTGQMLLGVLSMEPASLLHLFLTGVFFTAGLFVFAWLSKGKMGMGDVRLLGVTAMTAGWGFTFQILILAVALSFVYSMWLMIVCKKSMGTEFPFVPFLAAGMTIYMILLV